MVARTGVLRQSTDQREEVFLVARAGVQPATFALGVRCSMQLSYRATFTKCTNAGRRPDTGVREG